MSSRSPSRSTPTRSKQPWKVKVEVRDSHDFDADAFLRDYIALLLDQPRNRGSEDDDCFRVPAHP